MFIAGVLLTVIALFVTWFVVMSFIVTYEDYGIKGPIIVLGLISVVLTGGIIAEFGWY